MIRSIEKLRVEYEDPPFEETTLKKEPLPQFLLWWSDVIKAQEIEPNAMVLSTVSSNCHPSSRNVLLKKADKRGFVFFTNYQSRKAEQLDLNPHVALAFFWRSLHRQVLVEGRVEKVSIKETVAYFAKRPRNAQLAVHASLQSAPLASRLELEEAYLQAKKKFTGKKVPCPSFWGGYRVIPHRFEFWQGRKNRLHDRFLYVLVEGKWIISRLSP